MNFSKMLQPEDGGDFLALLTPARFHYCFHFTTETHLLDDSELWFSVVPKVQNQCPLAPWPRAHCLVEDHV